VFDFSANQFINVFIFFVPFIVLAFVVFKKRGQRFEMDRERCAKAWERVVAFIIDVVLCITACFTLNLCFKKLGLDVLQKNEEIGFFLLSWVYFSVFESSKYQATIGKMFESIIVTGLNGERLSFLRVSLRFFATILSDMSLFIGHIIIPFTRYKQGLHDMIANTLVLKKDIEKGKRVTH
jgi:uncharacterized RDD family membrane protein YckC